MYFDEHISSLIFSNQSWTVSLNKMGLVISKHENHTWIHDKIHTRFFAEERRQINQIKRYIFEFKCSAALTFPRFEPVSFVRRTQYHIEWSHIMPLTLAHWTRTKWSTFFRRRFQWHFRERHCLVWFNCHRILLIIHLEIRHNGFRSRLSTEHATVNYLNQWWAFYWRISRAWSNQITVT